MAFALRSSAAAPAVSSASASSRQALSSRAAAALPAVSAAAPLSTVAREQRRVVRRRVSLVPRAAGSPPAFGAYGAFESVIMLNLSSSTRTARRFKALVVTESGEQKNAKGQNSLRFAVPHRAS